MKSSQTERASETPSRLRVFISYASPDRDAVDAMREWLQARDVEVATADEVLTAPIKQELVSALVHSDVVIAVMGQGGASPGVLFEVGAAFAAGRPTLIVVEGREDLRQLPAALSDLPVVVLGGRPTPVADRLLATVQALVTDWASPVAATDAPISDSSPALPKPERDWADESERRVGEALIKLGAKVVTQGPGNAIERLDLAVWVPGLPTPQLNPILVEVTGRRPNVERSIDRLGAFMRERGSLLGVVVTADSRSRQWVIEGSLAILIIGVETLESKTRESFQQLMAEGRNQLFHAPR